MISLSSHTWPLWDWINFVSLLLIPPNHFSRALQGPLSGAHTALVLSLTSAPPIRNQYAFLCFHKLNLKWGLQQNLWCACCLSLRFGKRQNVAALSELRSLIWYQVSNELAPRSPQFLRHLWHFSVDYLPWVLTQWAAMTWKDNTGKLMIQPFVGIRWLP